MAKRFTDTEKWKKSFLKSMPAVYKLLWLYICDDCDHAGIWHVDMDIASIRVGEKISLKDSLAALNGKVIPFDGGEKWFIPSFIEFQYGELNEKNRVHDSILKILNKYKLSPYISPLQGAMDKDKDKDKDLDKEEVEKKSEQFPEADNIEPISDQNIKSAIEIYWLRKRVMLNDQQVKDFFRAFTLQSLDGKQFKENDYEVIRHFKNWLPKQEIQNPVIKNLPETSESYAAKRIKEMLTKKQAQA